MEFAYPPRTTILLTQILKIDQFPVGGIHKRNVIPIEIERTVSQTTGVAEGLLQDVLRPDHQLLCLHDGKRLLAMEQGLVCGTVVGRIFLQSHQSALAFRSRAENRLPACLDERGVYSLLASGFFGEMGEMHDVLILGIVVDFLFARGIHALDSMTNYR